MIVSRQHSWRDAWGFPWTHGTASFTYLLVHYPSSKTLPDGSSCQKHVTWRTSERNTRKRWERFHRCFTPRWPWGIKNGNNPSRTTVMLLPGTPLMAFTINYVQMYHIINLVQNVYVNIVENIALYTITIIVRELRLSPNSPNEFVLFILFSDIIILCCTKLGF